MDSHEILTGDMLQGLRIAGKNATMRGVAVTRTRQMAAIRKRKSIEADDDSVFEDADALVALAQKSFVTAAKAAVAENDRLGIPTHGSKRGKLVVRQPPKAGASRQP